MKAARFMLLQAKTKRVTDFDWAVPRKTESVAGWPAAQSRSRLPTSFIRPHRSGRSEFGTEAIRSHLRARRYSSARRPAPLRAAQFELVRRRREQARRERRPRMGIRGH